MQKKHCKQLGISLVLSMLLALLLTLNCPNTTATYSVPDKMAWWYDARFGMFIHFGSYSYLGHGEWAYALEGWSKANYQTQVSANFNPVNFDATAIANAARNAGMKYLVITAKHHEGFAMWNSQVASFKDYTGTTLYNLYNFTPFKNSGRDILMELKNACETAGIKFCLYYSILDWNHPSQSGTSFTTMASMTARSNYITDMKAQLRELITKYQPAVLWFDGDWTYNSVEPTLSSWWTKSDGEDLYKYVTELDPNLIINERVCRSFGIGDFDCPEQTVPTTPQSRQWETCQTMNSAWGYNASAEYSYKPIKSLIQELVTVVSRDGNYLLNIGPAGDGSVTPGSLNVLTGFQPWMATYGDSIYGTTGTPFMNGNSFNEPAWGRYTKKSGKLFAHVFTWPSNGTLTISGISNKISKIYLMNNPGTLLSYRINGSNIDIDVPGNAPDANVSVICIECTGIPTPGIPGSTPTLPPSLTPSATPTVIPTATATQVATPTPTVTTLPTPTTSAVNGNFAVSYIQNDWGSGATVNISIKNTGNTLVNGWELAFNFTGNQKITNLWCGSYSQTGTAVTINNASFNSTITPGSTVNFGFNINYSGSNPKPTSFTVNGITATTY